MRKIKPQLLRIDNSRQISNETDSEFLKSLELGLLLALKGMGHLNTLQFRSAVSALEKQYKGNHKKNANQV